MKLEYMREFLMLAKYKNFTRAADALFITQPGLSKHMDLLEKELGTSLLTRNTHQVALTEDGEQAIKAFQKILHIFDEYSENLDQKKKGIQGSLRIGMLYYTVHQDLGPILPFFRKQYPNVRIQTISGQPQEIYRALIDETIDIGILPPANYPNRNNLSFKVFNRTGASVMMSVTHPLARRASVTLSDLKKETIVLLKDDPCSTQFIQEALVRCDFQPAQTVEADHIDTVPFTIMEVGGVHINGTGFSIPGYEDQICVIPIDTKELYFEKAFCWNKNNQNSSIPIFIGFSNRN